VARTNPSIADSIRYTIMVTSALAVAVTAIVMFVIFVFLARGIEDKRTTGFAEIVAMNSASALAFKDVDRAEEVIATVMRAPNVIAVRMLDNAGAVLAETSRTEPATTVAHPLLRSTQSIAAVQVKSGNDTLGTVELTLSSNAKMQALWMFTAASLAIIAIMMVLLWIIARPIEKRISRPLLAFSVITRRIRETGNYALRVPSITVRELRGLSDDFNAMLQTIEKASDDVNERNSALSKMAYADPLTGAANRSRLFEQLGESVQAYGRTREPFVLIGIDLDNFKPLNDTLGHNVGDLFLKEAVKRCQEALRSHDTFARMGGDEFIALIPNVGDPDIAMKVARKLHAAIIAANCVHKLEVKCSSSMGLGIFPRDGQTTHELMARVDAAMYRAKGAGRDQIVTVDASTGH
jgi:diguanylate cyclase (GGDEF)-like protein